MEQKRSIPRTAQPTSMTPPQQAMPPTPTPTPSNDELLAIRQAAEGLEYPSESDAPFEVFQWPAVTAGNAKEAVTAKSAKGAAIEAVDVETFFKQLDATSDAEQFGKLRAALTAALTDLAVFRVGQVQVAIYVIGRTRGGDWAGVRTTAVET